MASLRLEGIDSSAESACISACFSRALREYPIVGDLKNREHVFGDLISDLEKCARRIGVQEILINQEPRTNRVLENMGYYILTPF